MVFPAITLSKLNYSYGCFVVGVVVVVGLRQLTLQDFYPSFQPKKFVKYSCLITLINIQLVQSKQLAYPKYAGEEIRANHRDL